MTIRSRFLLCLFAALIAFPEPSPAPVIFEPGKKVHYRAPGEEEIIGNANEMFAQAEAAANNGERSRAIKIYKKLVKKYPRANVSPEATWRAGVLTEQENDLFKAAAIYRGLMETYPQTKHFQEAIEAQFRIGEIFLNGKSERSSVFPLQLPWMTRLRFSPPLFVALPGDVIPRALSSTSAGHGKKKDHRT